MARGREVHADLVRAAGLGAHQHVRGPGEPLDGLEAGHGMLAPFAGPRDRARETGLAHEVPVEGAAVGKSSLDQRDVLALDRMAAEELLQRVEGGAVAREDERAGGVVVEPVHDAGVRPSAVAMLQVVDGAGPERVLLAGLGGHGQEARRLVDDEDVVVLVEHGEARAHRAAHGAVRVELDRGAGRDLEPGLLGRRAVDVDASPTHRLARGPAGQGELLRDREVEPHGSRSGLCGTRSSTKKSGSPMRASGRAPGP